MLSNSTTTNLSSSSGSRLLSILMEGPLLTPPNTAQPGNISCSSPSISSSPSSSSSSVSSSITCEANICSRKVELGEETGGNPVMVLRGCPRCFMYVMVQEQKQRCPGCKSTALVRLVLEG